MINEKQHLSIEKQVELLLKRGLQGDPAVIAEHLKVVNYYRLSGYWFPFQQGEDHIFILGTSFESIWRRYTFDRELRLLCLDAIERFEVTIRTQLAYHHALAHGPFGYALDRTSRPKLKPSDFAEFYYRLLEELHRSKEQCIKHFYIKYGDIHDAPPIWQVVEIMSFGSVVTLYRHTTSKVKQGVADIFGIPDTVLDSWLLAINTIRNICAHHSRLWNRVLGNKPMIPHEDNYPKWHTPVKVRNDRMFCILSICKYCLDQIAPQSTWPQRVKALFSDYPEIPIAEMGFPTDWENSPIWQRQEKVNLRGL